MSSCSLSTTNQGSWSLPYSAGGGPPVEDGLMSLEVRPSLSQIWSNTMLGPLARGSKRSVQLQSDPVREGGFEPPRPFGHRILSPARLPGSATLAGVECCRTEYMGGVGRGARQQPGPSW